MVVEFRLSKKAYQIKIFEELRIGKLFGEMKSCAAESVDKDDARLRRISSRLCPYLGPVQGGDELALIGGHGEICKEYK